MAKRQIKLIDQIRQAASECGRSQNALSRAAGMDLAALNRFISGKRGLSMESLDKLADVLDLHIIVGTAKTIESKSKQAQRKAR